MLPQLATLREIVRTAAREELLPRFADVQRHMKLDGSVVTEVDHAMQRRMQSELTRHWPLYRFLGEEMSAHEHEQLTQAKEGGMWCLDPLDGTSNYAAGIPYFSVSLALLIDGRTQI
ncbi:MAG: inositol monophosphatase family protein, partial [Pseudomonadota bacterium]